MHYNIVMHKKIAFVVLVLILLLAGSFYWVSNKNKTYEQKSSSQAQTENSFDPKNATYNIDGKEITLKNGKAEVDIPGTSSKTVVVLFGNPVYGQLQCEDSEQDSAVILSVNSGGSGTFYYLAAVINELYTNPDKTLADNVLQYSTKAIFLGDRIVPQNLDMKDGIVSVKYLDRKAGEAMSAKPSVTIIKNFYYGTGGAGVEYGYSTVQSDNSLVMTDKVSSIFTLCNVPQ